MSQNTCTYVVQLMCIAKYNKLYGTVYTLYIKCRSMNTTVENLKQYFHASTILAFRVDLR